MHICKFFRIFAPEIQILPKRYAETTMQSINKSIEIFSEEKYRNLPYGTIYYVAGTETPALNNYVWSRIESIEEYINQDGQNWVTCKIVYLMADNPLFPSREEAALYSAMMPEDNEFFNTGDSSFLVATLNECEPQNLKEAFAIFFTALLKMFDEVLDDGIYNPENLGLAYLDWDEDAIPCSIVPDEPFFLGRESFQECALRREVSPQSSTAFTSQPSHLVVTENTYHVLLPDLNKEFHFTTQVKALYILFLNHPEGIRIKEIADYKKEFTHIYLHITTWSDVERLREIVDKLLDVCNRNALDAKKSQCNRTIRETISDENLQKFYEIEVHHGEPHKINLDRSLVSMPDALYAKNTL